MNLFRFLLVLVVMFLISADLWACGGRFSGRSSSRHVFRERHTVTATVSSGGCSAFGCR